MPPAPDVIDRLLVAKGLLAKIRFLPAAHPDRISLAQAILTAHDAAELASAAVARHLNCLPTSPAYLMVILSEIKKDQGAVVVHRDYFSRLNTVRNSLKHEGIFPNPQQWHRVGERTYDYVSEWCQQYLGFSLDELDESALILNQEVKEFYDIAKDFFKEGQYKKSLEQLAFAAETLFRSNQALRNLIVGKARAEDAIKLSAFGVHANDYLALQEFLPSIGYDKGRYQKVIKWDQEKYGHPGNWSKDAVEFSLKTFVDVALRIQDASWIPGPIAFGTIYEYQITALVDDVEVVQEKPSSIGGLIDLLSPKREVVKILKKGESLRGELLPKARPFPPVTGLLSDFLGKEEKPILLIYSHDPIIFGEVQSEKVRVTCVPRENKLVHEYFPDLPEVDYEP